MKKKFDYKQFNIGDFVEVKKVIRRNLDGKGFEPVRYRDLPDGEKDLKDGKKTRVGVVTGVKNMKLGLTAYDQSCSFVETGTQMVWRVRFGLAAAENNALPEDLTKCEPPEKFGINGQRLSESEKKVLSEAIAGEPRKANGQFA